MQLGWRWRSIGGQRLAVMIPDGIVNRCFFFSYIIACKVLIVCYTFVKDVRFPVHAFHNFPQNALRVFGIQEEHEFASGLVFPTIHASESSDDEFDLKVPTKHGPHEGERQKHDQADRGTLQEVTKSESASMSERRRYGPPQSFDNEFELLQ
ncbi:hypothetical protein KIN20_014890 [Parelaphostrongylus tenuis]|uniref:Uncharacterized protein n=1 Tax=Parelaphostrongylus tenuis TaxID=148309 RepID=A0AAD5QPI0_PARTN|nr:hypothetical protein KIN20_014890 [Parelaphostrongylus tenuis]